MSMQIFTCPGGPEGQHQWTRPAQRGRPPSHCPKHPPSNERKNGGRDKTEDHADNDKVDPNPPASDTPVQVRDNPFITRAKNPFIERAKRAAEERQAEVEPEPEPVDLRSREEQILEESEAIEEKVKHANTKYLDAFVAASSYKGDEDPHVETREAARLWDRADKAQNALINHLNRRRVLNAEMEKLTAPAL